MEALGLLSAAEPLSVHELQSRLNRQGRDLAYTTVMTVLSRLHEKGVVKREKSGRQFFYAPAKGAERATDGLVAKVHKALFRNDRLRPIVALIKDDDELSDAELEELKALVERRLERRRSERP